MDHLDVIVSAVADGWASANVAVVGDPPEPLIAIYPTASSAAAGIYVVIEDDASNFVGGGAVLYLAGPGNQIYAVSKAKTSLVTNPAYYYLITPSEFDIKSDVSPIRPLGCRGETQQLTPRQVFCRDTLYPAVAAVVAAK